MKDALKFTLIAVFAIVLFGGIGYLKYQSFMRLFPHAQWYDFILQSK